LGGGTDSLTHPVSVRGDELVVEVLDLVGGTSTYGVGVWVLGTGGGAGGGSGGCWESGGWGDHGSRDGHVTVGEDAGDDGGVSGRSGSDRRGGGRRLRGLGRPGLGRSTTPWELNLLVSAEADVQAVSREDRLALDRVSTIPKRLDISKFYQKE